MTTFDENTSNASEGGFGRRGSARRTPPPRSLRRRTLAPPGADGGSVVDDKPEGSVEVDILGASGAGAPRRTAGRKRDPSAEQTPRRASPRDARARRAPTPAPRSCARSSRDLLRGTRASWNRRRRGQARAAAGCASSTQRPPSKTTRSLHRRNPDSDAPPPFSRVPPRRQRDARRDGSARGSSARRGWPDAWNPVALLRLFRALRRPPAEEAFAPSTNSPRDSARRRRRGDHHRRRPPRGREHGHGRAEVVLASTPAAVRPVVRRRRADWASARGEHRWD